MGLYSNAEMVWGIPVLAYDEDTGEPTPFWSEEDEDWRELPGELEIRQYGHYEDPDNQRGILTITSIESYRADCWEPTRAPTTSPAAAQRLAFLDQIRMFSKPLTEMPGWWLVASFG
jgi:hypothetical protein